MVASAHQHRSVFALEGATPGTPPSAANWQTNGKKIHMMGPPDLSGVKEVITPDPRTTDRLNGIPGYGIKGTRNCEASITVPFDGHGGTTSDNTQISESDTGVLLTNCMGGSSRNNKDELDAGGGHTTTVLDLADNTNFATGQCLAWADANGDLHSRQFSLSASQATLTQALPATPSNADTIYPMETNFIDPDVLKSSSGGSDRTLSWWFALGESANAFAELAGCRCELGLEGFEKDGLAAITLGIKGSRFTLSEDGTTVPSWSGDPTNGAPLSIGNKTKLWFQDYGTTTQTAAIHLASISFDISIAAEPIPTVTSQTADMQGLEGWSTSRAEIRAELVIVPEASSYDADLQAGTFKHLQIEVIGAEGSIGTIIMGRCEITETVEIVEMGPVVGLKVMLLAHEVLDAFGTTAIAKSPLIIARG